MTGELTGDFQSTGEGTILTERNPQTEIKFGSVIKVHDDSQSGEASSVSKTFVVLDVHITDKNEMGAVSAGIRDENNPEAPWVFSGMPGGVLVDHIVEVAEQALSLREVAEAFHRGLYSGMTVEEIEAVYKDAAEAAPIPFVPKSK